jgi:hypothetical protein
LESSNFPCPFFWLLCCLAFKLRLLIAHLASSIFLALFRLVIVLAGLQIKASDSPFDIFKLFLSFFFWLLCWRPDNRITKRKRTRKVWRCQRGYQKP